MIKAITIHPATDAESFLLSLISEELKSRKFFNTLLELGLDNSYYQPHLDEAILSCLGITDESNATLDFYFTVMNEHAEKIGVKEESVVEQAKVVYSKLVEYGKSLAK